MHLRQLQTKNYSSEKASLKLKEALTGIDELEAKVSNLENQLKAKDAKLSSVLDYKDDIIKKKSFTLMSFRGNPLYLNIYVDSQLTSSMYYGNALSHMFL